MGIKPFPPAHLDVVKDAEAKIGFRLPDLLRLLYLEIGNGGFGPSYGILGLADGATDDLGQNGLHQWDCAHNVLPQHLPGNPASPHPYLFPCIYCGCTIYLCVDCRVPDGQMWEFDPGNGDEWQHIFSPLQITMPELMSQWLQDRRKELERTLEA